MQMIKYFLFIAALIVILAGVPRAQAVNDAAAFEGTWILNKDKSDTGWNFAPGTWEWIIKVEQNKVTITQDYPPKSVYQDCELILFSDNSGETNPNCFERSPDNAASKTFWKKGKLIREYQTVSSTGKSILTARFRETFSLSKAGRFVLERRKMAGPRLPTAAQDRIGSTDDEIYTFVFDRKK
jgi:hypothetical protein